MIPLFSQKHTKEDNMLAFFLLEKDEIMLLTYEKKMEEQRICFIQEAKNVHIMDKQVLI